MTPKLTWLTLCQLLLSDAFLCQVLTLPARPRAVRAVPAEEAEQEDGDEGRSASLRAGAPSKAEGEEEGEGGGNQPGVSPAGGSHSFQGEFRALSARRMVDALSGTLRHRLAAPASRGNLSCADMVAPLSEDAGSSSSSSVFPRQLVSLSLVPALAVLGCPREAQALVLGLYQAFGVGDTHELLLQLAELMERSPGEGRDWRRLQAVLRAGARQCQGWLRLTGTLLLGQEAAGPRPGGPGDAMQECCRLGPRCAGVSGREGSGRFAAVLRRGSRIVPSADSQSWIQDCAGAPAEEEEGVGDGGTPGRRGRRSPGAECAHETEERVYSVVGWIPAVSTLYGLGTAAYYASVNCSHTARERALLSAVDLGTDALIAVSGGTVGIAGYALGSGLKTGVKAGIRYLLNRMKQGQDLVFEQDYRTPASAVD
ncbi:uncharacterized protein apof [Lepisosteus oculatus]|uniref:uncharacterized protein apof n=1 Tax=Lepisosteus oculatus TaxID=7918 RepID=UPI0035F51935